MPDFNDRDPADVREEAVIQELCQKTVDGIAEPAEIWEALEAEGIDVTPGQLYQAIAHVQERQQEGAADAPRPEGLAGLTAADLEVIASLAERAGGVAQLRRILSVMEHVAR